MFKWNELLSMYRTEKRGLRVIYGKTAVVRCWCLRTVLIAQICCLWLQALAAKNENCSQHPFKSLLGWEVADTLCPDLSWSTGSQTVGRSDPFKASPKTIGKHRCLHYDS